jgi:hypothetical protein
VQRSPAAWDDFPCVECGKRVPGLHAGDRCPDCRWAREARASRWGRLAGLIGALLYGLWAIVTTPASPKWSVALGVPATYLVVRMLVSRFAVEALK